jgi:hypothetical protein
MDKWKYTVKIHKLKGLRGWLVSIEFQHVEHGIIENANQIAGSRLEALTLIPQMIARFLEIM